MWQKMLLFLGISAGLFFTSCQEDITLEVPPYENKLAVYCVLQPDSLPRLFLNRSKSYFNYTDKSLEYWFIKDAQVIIKDLTNGVIDTLKSDSGMVKDNTGAEYFTRYYIGKHTAQTGHKYSLDIRHKEKHVTAETFVPMPVVIKSVKHDIDREYTNLYVYYDDNASQSNAYNLILSTYIAQWNGQQYVTREMKLAENNYKYDKLKNGGEMESDFYSDYDIRGYIRDTNSIYVTIENNTTQTAEYIESVFGQIYNGEDNFFTEPSIIKHNIVGGLGVFGAVTPSKKYKIIF